MRHPSVNRDIGTMCTMAVTYLSLAAILYWQQAHDNQKQMEIIFMAAALHVQLLRAVQHRAKKPSRAEEFIG